MRGDKQVSRKDWKGEKERRGLNQEAEGGEKRREEERTGGSWRCRFWKFRP